MNCGSVLGLGSATRLLDALCRKMHESAEKMKKGGISTAQMSFDT